MKIHICLITIITAVLVLTAACAAAPPTQISTPTDNQTVAKPTFRPPVITDIVGSRESAPSTEMQLMCMAKDYNGGTLTYAWSIDQGTIKDGDEATGDRVIWITPDTTGSYDVTVNATSSKGGETSFTKSFKIVTYPFGNKPVDNTVYLKFDTSPSTLVKVTAPAVIMEFSEIQCEVPNQDINTLTFKWSSPVGKLAGDGIAEGKASRVGWIAPGVPGKYTVSVTITDKSGHDMSGEVEFDVATMRQ
ncbi:MAG: hypothetical protein JXA01_06600 [Dehalococcoidia bacterium]|nr:hypothetical protein [Dehalococcoidia bacterium]